MAAVVPRTATRPSVAVKQLGRMPRVIASAHDLREALRRSAELVAEAIRADATAIRIGPPASTTAGQAGVEVLHVRRPWGGLPPEALPTRLTVPLVLRGRRLGVLTALRARRRPFPQTARALVGAFAGPIAMAVDNARLFDALQDRLADVARLGEASEAVAALGELGAVGAQLARQAAHLLGAERAAVLLLDRERGELVAQSPAYGYRPSQVHRLTIAADDRPKSEAGGAADSETAGWDPALLEAGRPYISNDVPGDRRGPARSARELGERSILIVALRAGQTLGALRVANKQHGLFTRQDARLLGVFAAQAAVALENAILYAEAVREREQLKELERLKSQFLSLVSHELRTPLASIKASAEILLSTAPDGVPEAHRRLLRNIDRSSDRLSALITDLLDLVRLEGGRLELDRERLDLRQIAEDAVATIRPLADERRQMVRTNVSSDPCVVDGDRRRLEQVVLNLLTNAIKYGHQAGTIRLDVGTDVDGAGGRRAYLKVRDEGPGIPGDEQPMVFERFYRRDTEETRRATGTGLGLPIARALVELHGGSLSLESADGRGSTFSISLPEADDENPDR